MSSRPSGETKPTVLLADDHADVLTAVRDLVSSRFDVVSAVNSGQAALEAAAKLHPDLVVVDISMPGLDGFQTVKELRRMGLAGRVVFLSMHGDPDYIAAAGNCGAQGYVLKSRMQTDLLTVLDRALIHREFVPPTV